jgi:RND family efflux transporter MFP subunit
MQRTVTKLVSWCALLAIAAPPCLGESFEAFTEPYRRVAIPAPEIGVIAEILVREGDAVAEKQLLARLDDAVLQASLAVARAAKDATGTVRIAENEVTVREQQLQSYRELGAQGNASPRELQRAESEYQQSLAQLQIAREELEVRRLEFERVKAQIQHRLIESPLSGLVISIDKELGEFVSPTDATILHIAELETLKSVFSIPLQSARTIHPGQSVNVEVGYDLAPASAVIEFVSPVSDAQSGTVRVKLRIPNPDGKLQSGVNCRWTLQLESTPQRTTRSPSGAGSIR